MPPPAQAQSPVNLTAARHYAKDLDHNFWEQAWAETLAEKADRDGSIDWRYSTRRDLSELTADYRHALQERNGFWTNVQVEDYLRRRLLTVQPNPMMPGRPGAFQLRVLSTPVPNALAFNDGTIFLTTGLLATPRTETLRNSLAER